MAPSDGPDSEVLRSRLRSAAPGLFPAVESLMLNWTRPILERLRSYHISGPLHPKAFNDPVWGTIELSPWETLLLDSPLLQRLRGVRQLGMAHQVYPSAGYDRLEHSRGVVAAAQRMLDSLERNRRSRVQYGGEQDREIPSVSHDDRVRIRFAALLHDIGHGPYSHASEDLIATQFRHDYEAAQAILTESFEGVQPPPISEVLAAMMILSSGLKEVFSHDRFDAGNKRAQLPAAIVARLLGSRNLLDATYLSGVISGPIDADKLDYMARDCHHAGLPLGLDIIRLIQMLEVITLTAENLPKDQPELRARVERAPNGRYHELGISASGLTAYEQLIIARVMLFDRLYHHHKVRSAEAMLRRLFEVVARERAHDFALAEFFQPYSDETMLLVLGGELSSPTIRSADSTKTRTFLHGFSHHDLFCRAFVFAPRFIAGLDGLQPEEQIATREKRLRQPLRELSTASARRDLEKSIYERAVDLMSAVAGLSSSSSSQLTVDHVIIDVPSNKTIAHRADNLLMRSVGGGVSTPNLYFDPIRWSNAYETQKRCSFVFCPRPFVPAVALAARIEFAERFGIVMDDAAHWHSKTSELVTYESLEKAHDHGLVSDHTFELLKGKRTKLLRISPEDLILPSEWRNLDPGLTRRLSEGFDAALSMGLPFNEREMTVKVISGLASVVRSLDGKWASTNHLDEVKELQPAVRELLEMRDVRVQEGAIIAGGRCDLIAYDHLVIENKVHKDKTNDPHSVGPNFEWQERRYSMRLCSRVDFQVVAYRPIDEKGVLQMPERVSVSCSSHEGEERAVVRFVVPFGYDLPSRAKRPKTTTPKAKSVGKRRHRPQR